MDNKLLMCTICIKILDKVLLLKSENHIKYDKCLSVNNLKCTYKLFRIIIKKKHLVGQCKKIRAKVISGNEQNKFISVIKLREISEL